MSDNRKKPSEEEPQEEFVDDGVAKDERETDSEPETSKYEKWSLKKLRHKAEEKSIDGYEKLNREELINNLKNIDS